VRYERPKKLILSGLKNGPISLFVDQSSPNMVGVYGSDRTLQAVFQSTTSCSGVLPFRLIPFRPISVSNNFVPIRRNGITVRDRVRGRNGVRVRVRDRSKGRDRVRVREMGLGELGLGEMGQNPCSNLEKFTIKSQNGVVEN